MKVVSLQVSVGHERQRAAGDVVNRDTRGRRARPAAVGRRLGICGDHRLRADDAVPVPGERDDGGDDDEVEVAVVEGGQGAVDPRKDAGPEGGGRAPWVVRSKVRSSRFSSIRRTATDRAGWERTWAWDLSSTHSSRLGRLEEQAPRCRRPFR